MKLIIKKGLFFLVFNCSYLIEDPNPTELSLNSVSTWEAGLITATMSFLFADQSHCSHLQQ